FVWSPAETLSCYTCSSTTASPNETTRYYITITDIDGCSRKDSILVTVIENCTLELYVPNAFSPNGDGENDVLYVKTRNNNCIRSMIFEIYDRWGNRVFESKDILIGWNGKRNGKEYDPDVFVYNLKATLTNRTSLYKKGNVSLIR